MPAWLGVQGPGDSTMPCGLQRQGLIGGQGVVALHPDVRTQFAQEVEQVVGEAVIIIDQEKHAEP